MTVNEITARHATFLIMTALLDTLLQPAFLTQPCMPHMRCVCVCVCVCADGKELQKAAGDARQPVGGHVRTGEGG